MCSYPNAQQSAFTQNAFNKCLAIERAMKHSLVTAGKYEAGIQFQT